MDRRRFLSWLVAGAGAAVVDPEQLLWVPGKKTIFIPKVTAAERKPVWDELARTDDCVFMTTQMTIAEFSRLYGADMATSFKNLFNPPGDLMRFYLKTPIGPMTADSFICAYHG